MLFWCQNTCHSFLQLASAPVENKSELHIPLHSIRKAQHVSCPCCGGKVEVHDHTVVTLYEMPELAGKSTYLPVRIHRCRTKVGFPQNSNPREIEGTLYAVIALSRKVKTRSFSEPGFVLVDHQGFEPRTP